MSLYPCNAVAVALQFFYPSLMVEMFATSVAAMVDANIQELSRMGFGLSLDDYGTGYSNLARLMKLPFDIVKLDKTLADGLDDPALAAMITSTVDVMHDTGVKVLIEGVETEDQAKRLIEMGVDYIQGYYYARPMPQDAFLAFLAQHN